MSGDATTSALRHAVPADLPALHALIARSVRGLNASLYTDAQVESALRHVFGPDTQLIADRTYFVIDAPAAPGAPGVPNGALAAAGGWSRRRTLYGGDQTKTAEDPLLDPAVDPARIRAFFVDPAHARQGLARRLFERCAAEAAAAGFRALALGATLPGVPLYRALGFVEVGRVDAAMPGGEMLPIIEMRRALPG
jgi:GNAT superfamily N-acetyltransferase